MLIIVVSFFRRFLSCELSILLLRAVIIKRLALIQPSFFIFNYFFMNFYLDKINSLILTLTLLILFIRFISSYKVLKLYFSTWIKIMYIMFLTLIIFFFTNSLIRFYIYFELSIIPIFTIIIGWGYQVERLHASLALIFYTISASIPFFVFLLIYFSNQRIFFFTQLFFLTNCLNLFWLGLLSSRLAFLVKLPIFIAHLWLPKAHVEAPIIGSIILASILLKLGGYSLVRLSNFLSTSSCLSFIISLAVTGTVLIRLICITQIDIKVIIAYSSVAHICLTIRSLLYMRSSRVISAILLIVSHGISSSVIFFGGNLFYERTFSRSIILIKSLLTFLPVLSFFWLFAIIRSIGTPPILNFISEIICISSIIRFSLTNTIWIILCIFLAGAYSIILYSSTHQSNFFSINSIINSSLIIESLIFFFHLFWILILPLSLEVINL